MKKKKVDKVEKTNENICYQCEEKVIGLVHVVHQSIWLTFINNHKKKIIFMMIIVIWLA